MSDKCNCKPSPLGPSMCCHLCCKCSCHASDRDCPCVCEQVVVKAVIKYRLYADGTVIDEDATDFTSTFLEKKKDMKYETFELPEEVYEYISDKVSWACVNP